MMRLALLLILGALSFQAETVITFAPQGAITSRVSMWSVAGCPAKAVPASVVYALATHRGIPWISPKTAGELFTKKSAWSRTVKAVGWISAGGAVLVGSDWVKAKPQWTTALAVGGAVILVLLPLAAKEVPTVDPAAGGPLMLGADGCGTTSFYAAPSNVAGFNEVLP